jgi:hypothetical protein
MLTFKQYLTEQISDSDLRQLEQFFDNLFAALQIDVEFTRHFKDRVNDARNGKPITIPELTKLFRDAMNRYGKKIHDMRPDAEAVLKDLSTQLNLPFVVKYDRASGDVDVVAKTIMRKRDFMTSSPVLKV